MGTDLSALRQQLAERRQRLRELNNRTRVIQFQIFNYEDIDETRRALSEHLMVERKMQDTHRDQRASVTAERVEQLVREIHQLEKQQVEGQPDAAAAEERLAVERQRAERARAREETETAQHQRLVRERNEALARSPDGAQHGGDGAEKARELSERGDRLAAAITSVRAELDGVLGRERDEVHEILGQLEAEQRAAEECQNVCGELETQLAEAESAAEAVRRRTADLRRLATLAAADAGNRDLPSAVGGVRLPPGESLSDAVVTLTESTAQKAQPPPPPKEEEPPEAPVKEQPPEAPVKDEPPQAPPPMEEESKKVDLSEFTRRLLRGDRIVKLPKLATVTFAEPWLAQCLMKADTFARLMDLTAAERRQQLIPDLHGFYRRGLIDLAAAGDS